MSSIISLILFLIFLLLAGLHTYWGFGGRWASEAVVPTKNNDAKIIMPKPYLTLIVAAGLLAFGFVALLNAPGIDLHYPAWLRFIRYSGLWTIASIFISRAIGEFKYVGFFKKYRHTKFGRYDTHYYSPLCLIIAMLAIILQLIN